ncbi:hypothetical protein FHU30_001299 [Actinomadura rupiterrae]|nr:hypothetical protein [Actinomadura rupiterrae]
MEVAHLAEGIGLRDSRDPDGPELAVTQGVFAGLLAEVRHRTPDR